MAQSSDFSIENSRNYDLDLFLYDSKKIIHIATAGMELINTLNQIDFDPISNFKKVLSYRRMFRYNTIKNLDRDNLNSVLDYIYFFNLMAKRGFYSYDKVDIDKRNDYTFQLISKPLYGRKIFIPSVDHTVGNLLSKRQLVYDLNFLSAKKDFPENFEYFNIQEYI